MFFGQVRPKPANSATETSHNTVIVHVASLTIILSNERIIKTHTRLSGYAGWSVFFSMAETLFPISQLLGYDSFFCTASAYFVTHVYKLTRQQSNIEKTKFHTSNILKTNSNFTLLIYNTFSEYW